MDKIIHNSKQAKNTIITIYIPKSKLIIANNFYTRLKGLMFTSLPSFKRTRKLGMLFYKTNWIHTFFMKFSIKIIYLKNNKLVHTKTASPNKILLPVFKANTVLEIPLQIYINTPTSIIEKLKQYSQFSIYIKHTK